MESPPRALRGGGTNGSVSTALPFALPATQHALHFFDADHARCQRASGSRRTMLATRSLGKSIATEIAPSSRRSAKRTGERVLAAAAVP